MEKWQRPRGVVVDFGPKQSGWLINQLGDPSFTRLERTNPSVGIDIMDDCLAMYHKKFDAHCISFVSAQCLGRGQF